MCSPSHTLSRHGVNGTQVMYLEPRERVAEAMARAGSSISVTSLTDLVAFLAGSYSSIPVVEAFCQYVPPSAWIVCALTVPTVVVGGFIRSLSDICLRHAWQYVQSQERPYGLANWGLALGSPAGSLRLASLWTFSCKSLSSRWQCTWRASGRAKRSSIASAA